MTSRTGTAEAQTPRTWGAVWVVGGALFSVPAAVDLTFKPRAQGGKHRHSGLTLPSKCQRTAFCEGKAAAPTPCAVRGLPETSSGQGAGLSTPVPSAMTQRKAVSTPRVSVRACLCGPLSAQPTSPAQTFPGARRAGTALGAQGSHGTRE